LIFGGRLWLGFGVLSAGALNQDEQDDQDFQDFQDEQDLRIIVVSLRK
jgi:hypothetical protein